MWTACFRRQATDRRARVPHRHPCALAGCESGGNFFAGTVDDVRVYNYQLSASQVAALAAAQPLPSPWTSLDIGGPASPGYANYASTAGIWSLGGGGADIWGASDQFQFASQSVSGPAGLVARVTSGAIISDGTTNANAKAGIMFRDSTATNAPFVALEHDQTQGLQFIYRDTAGAAAAQSDTNLPVNPPIWLELVRSNNTFYAYYSASLSAQPPATWILIGSHTTTMADPALAGVVITAHDNARPGQRDFHRRECAAHHGRQPVASAIFRHDV